MRAMIADNTALMAKVPEIRVTGITGLPEVTPGSDLVGLIIEAARQQDVQFSDGDILVFTQKVVSKAEGRLVRLPDVEPSALAEAFARDGNRDPRSVEVVLAEARRVVKMDRGILITETHHGLVCAQAGVDASNVPDLDTVALLPADPDRSAAHLRSSIRERTGAVVAVIISDTFGRPWREGLTNVAIGVDGMAPLIDYRGQKDPHGRSLLATIIAIADELASAAELVMGKLDRVPVALIRGYSYRADGGKGADLVRPADKDLFR
jgi:coenzyme F420-0:L-glutamate ligase/coenzyme F420-1:gamma-L-glutamate ligase